MPGNRHKPFYLWGIIILLLATIVTACNGNETERDIPNGIQTKLLVEQPETALPIGSPLTVRSQTEAIKPGVSHVELYAVQLPSGEQDILIRSDAAPFDQTTFTAAQRFTPMEPGHYVIKVVGYNRLGQSTESEYISFEIE